MLGPLLSLTRRDEVRRLEGRIAAMDEKLSRYTPIVVAARTLVIAMRARNEAAMAVALQDLKRTVDDAGLIRERAVP